MESYNGVLYSKSDAFYLIEAARNDIIPLIKQRLSSFERQRCIKSGAVFIWNEKNSNIKRWTDGRKWSASRVTGTFLTYKEMKPPSVQDQSCHIVDYKDNGLLKQSFSYNIGDDKYHIISYICENDNSIQLQRPSHDVRFKSLSVTSYIDEVIGCQPIYSSKCKGKGQCNKDHTCDVQVKSPSLSSSPSSSSSSLEYNSSSESSNSDSEENNSSSITTSPLPPIMAHGKLNERPTLPPLSSFDQIPRSAPTLNSVLNAKLVHPLPMPISTVPSAKRARLM